MKIGMLLDSDFPHDPRVEREIISLVNAGNEIHLLCINYKGQNRPAYEMMFGAHIHRITITKKLLTIMRGTVNTFPFYNWWLSNHLIPFVLKTGIQALHIHDLFLFGSAFLANKKLNLPIIGDLHECYVDAMQYYKFSTTFPRKLFVNIPKWYETEKKWVRQADKLIVVAKEAIELYYEKAKIPPEKFIVAPNTVLIDHYLSFGIEQNIIERFKDYFTIGYVGKFSMTRGLNELIQAIPLVISTIPNLKILLVGSGASLPDAKKLTKELNVEDYVVFEGWQSHKLLPTYVAASTIGVFPHIKSVQLDNITPNKLFEFMLMKKPLIVSNCRPTERIVKQEQCGLVYESGNVKQLAECIIELYKNSEKMKQMGENGHKAVQERWNWDITIQPLLDFYAQLESEIK